MFESLISLPPEPEPTDFEDLFDDGLYSSGACGQCGDYPCPECGGCAGVSCFCVFDGDGEIVRRSRSHVQGTPDVALVAGLAPERW